MIKTKSETLYRSTSIKRSAYRHSEPKNMIIELFSLSKVLSWIWLPWLKIIILQLRRTNRGARPSMSRSIRTIWRGLIKNQMARLKWSEAKCRMSHSKRRNCSDRIARVRWVTLVSSMCHLLSMIPGALYCYMNIQLCKLVEELVWSIIVLNSFDFIC